MLEPCQRSSRLVLSPYTRVVPEVRSAASPCAASVVALRSPFADAESNDSTAASKSIHRPTTGSPEVTTSVNPNRALLPAIWLPVTDG